MDDQEKLCLSMGFILGIILIMIAVMLGEIFGYNPIKEAANNGWFSCGGKYYTVQEYGPVTNNPPEKEKQ